MKTLKRKIPLWILVVTVLFCSIKITAAKAALPELEIDYDVYSLWIDEVPEGIWDSTYIVAKLTKTSLDPDMYILSLIDDVTSLNTLKKAMTTAGVNPTSNRSFAMDATLYKYDEDEGDYYPSKDSDVEVICPIADAMYQYDEDEEPYLNTNLVKVVSVNSSGKLTYPSFTLVTVDDIICAKFTITDNLVYGFLLNGVAPTPSEESGNATPKPTATKAPTATPKPTATKAPTATPKPTATKAPTATPTKAASSATTSNSTPTPTPKTSASITAGAGIKDTTPKTGDDHSSGRLLLLGSAAAIALGFVIVRLKKEAREDG